MYLFVFSAKKKFSVTWKWAKKIIGITVCPSSEGLAMVQGTLRGLPDFIQVCAPHALSIN